MVSLDVQAFIDRLKKRSAPQEILAVDFSQAEINGARLRRLNGATHLLAADILPRPKDESAAPQKGGHGRIDLPKSLLCRHVVLCLPGKNALVKLLSIPGQLDGDSQTKIREDMGVGSGDYRIGYKVLGHSHVRGETRLLAVALPENDLQHHLAFFSAGWPVPISLEVAGLAAINSFVGGYLDECGDESIGVVQFERDVSFFAFIYKKELVLIRKYEFGDEHILNAIQSRLNVNRETALNVAADKSFDISQMIKEVCDPFIRQVVISKHFVERREDCRVSRIFIPDSMMAIHRLAGEIRIASEANVEQWDSFKAVTVQQEAVGSKLADCHSLLAASIGAGIGFLVEQSK